MRCARPWRASSNGCAPIPRHDRPRARHAWHATKSWLRRNFRSATKPTRSIFRPARGWASWSSRSKGLSQGIRRPAVDRQPEFQHAAAAASSASSARTAPARPHCSACSRAPIKPDGGDIRIGPTVKLAYVDQSRQTLDDKKTVWEEISGGQDIIRVDNYETPSRRLRRTLQFQGHAAAAAHRRALGR